MAKMFYTLAEAKEKLGMNEDEIKQLAREGRLREFRDGPRLMFKADQVEQIRSERYGQMADPDSVPLNLRNEDPLVPLSLDDSDIGSGSGLLALTRESDDTSIGDALLNDDPDDTALGMELLDEIVPKPKKKPTSWDNVAPPKRSPNDDLTARLKRLEDKFDKREKKKGDWAPKPSIARRVFVSIVLLAIGFAAGFGTFFLLALK